MCDPQQMTYAPFHNWQAGFLTGYVDGDNCWIDMNQFRGDDVVFEGKLYKG